MDNKLHIMAVGAHIIDAELSCGKTLAKHAMLGDKVTTVALTAGENGHPTEYTKEEFRKINIEGANEFARMIGGQFICMDFDDSKVPESEEIYDRFADLIRKEKPDVILTHWDGSSHEDHNMAPKIVRKAVRRAGFSDSENYSAHRVKQIYYAENWEDMSGFLPYLYVDVTDVYECWYEAMQKIYLATHAKYFNYLEYYAALSRVRGELAYRTIRSCKYAECFAISEQARNTLFTVKDSLHD